MASWTVDVELLAAITPRAEDLDHWMTQLADHSPDFGICETSTSVDGTMITVTVTLEAETLPEAVASALKLVEEATGGRAHGVMALSTLEYDSRVERPFNLSVPFVHSPVAYTEIADIAGV